MKKLIMFLKKMFKKKQYLVEYYECDVNGRPRVESTIRYKGKLIAGIGATKNESLWGLNNYLKQKKIRIELVDEMINPTVNTNKVMDLSFFGIFLIH